MKRSLRLAAAAAVLALPVLAVQLAGAASAATTAPPPPPCNHPAAPANPNGHVEALIGNVSPAAGSTVSAGATISFLYADETPFGESTATVTNPTITVNGTALTSGVTVGAQESGVPITYANPSDGGSTSTSCENPISFTLPSADSGTVTITATVYDSDNDHETITWTYTVPPPTTVPVGAVGGLGAAAAVGLILMVTQTRRHRRNGTPPQT